MRQGKTETRVCSGVCMSVCILCLCFVHTGGKDQKRSILKRFSFVSLSRLASVRFFNYFFNFFIICLGFVFCFFFSFLRTTPLSVDGAAAATSTDILSAASHGMEMAAMVGPSPIVFPTTADSHHYSNSTNKTVGDDDSEVEALGGARLPGAGRGPVPRSSQIRM
jgi:hypothetical protein